MRRLGRLAAMCAASFFLAFFLFLLVLILTVCLAPGNWAAG